MSLNAGEVEVLLKLRDELTAKLVAVRAQMKDVGAATTGMGDVINNAGERIKTSFSGSAVDVDKFSGRISVSDKEVQKHLASTGSLTGTFRAFDGVLASLGINVGKHVKGLEDATNIADSGISTFGKLAIGVGSAAAAFNVGWDFGKWIGGITGLEKAIGQTVDRMSGLDAVTYAAKMDTLERASRNAGHTITNMTEAIRINAEAIEKAADKKIDWVQKLSSAQREVRGLSEAVMQEIEIAQKAGATTQQITNRYGLSAEAQKALTERHKLAAEIQKVAQKADEDRAAAIKKLDNEYAKLMSDVKNANQLAIMEAEAQKMATDALTKKNTAAWNWVNQQVKATATVKEAIEWEKNYLAEQDRLTASTDSLGQSVGNAANVISTAFNSALDSAGEKMRQTTLTWSEAMDKVRRGEGSMTGTVQAPMTDAQWRAKAKESGGRVMTDGYGNRYVHVPGQNVPGTVVPGFKDGGPTKEGLAYVHDDEYVVPKGGALVSGGSSKASVVVNNTFNIVDTESNIVRRVSDRIMRTMMSGTQMAGS